MHATVTAPVPPGVGVALATIPSIDGRSASPIIFPDGPVFMPISITVDPTLSIPPFRKPGLPTAEITISAPARRHPGSWVDALMRETVPLAHWIFWDNSIPSG